MTPEKPRTLDIFAMTDDEFRADCRRLAAQAEAWGGTLRRVAPHLLEPAGPLGADPDTDGNRAPKAPRRLPHGPRLRNI
jgi:hypothetical protein